MAKQDRQGVRKATDLEQKYRFGRKFSEQEKKLLRQQEKIVSIDNSVSENKSITDNIIVVLDDTLEDVDGLNNNMTEFDLSLSQLSKRIDDSNVRIKKLEDNAELLVTVNVDSLDSSTLSADKSFSEISDAINAGRDVRVKVICLGEGQCIYLDLVSYKSGSEANFSGYHNGNHVTLQVMAD